MYGYNIKEGGSTSKNSAETRRKISLAKKGKPGPLGRIVSAETRKKISEGLKNFHNKSIDSTAESFRAIDISKPTIPQR